MNIWLLIFSALHYISYSTNHFIEESSSDVNIEYTYYFKTHRYEFHSNFEYDEDDHHNTPIHIQHDDIDINILFFNNESQSFTYHINNNITKHYSHDSDWNEIQNLVITSPSQITTLELPFIDNNEIEYTNMMYTINDENSFNQSNTSSLSTTHRRRLYTREKKRGKFIGIKHARRFHDAERVCRHRFGGELASIMSSSDNSRAQKLCKQLHGRSSCWIGLRRPFKQWTNGRRVSYKKWQPGEPNNAGRKESCTEMYRSSGRWNDNRCHRTRPFICERARTSKNKKYIGVGMALDWDNANDYCHRRFGTELATIRSSDDNSQVRRRCNAVARKGSCWIGLERPFKKWEDGKRVSYKKWNPGEPNNHGKGESCTEMYRSQKWNDVSCRRGRFFVCNYKGIDNRKKKRRRRGSRSRRRRRRKSCSRGSYDQRKRCRARRRKARRRRGRRRRYRWKCSRQRFNDYERKECLRQRRGLVRRVGRRRARREWRAKVKRWLDKQSKKTWNFLHKGGDGRRRDGMSRMARKIRMMGREMGGRMGRRMRRYGRRIRRDARRERRQRRRAYYPPPPPPQGMYGMGMPPVSGGLGAVPPPIHMPRPLGSKLPPPPRIQLIDLGRSSGRRLGVGLNIGMTGHHKHYEPSTYALQAMRAEGATKREMKQAMELAQVGMDQEKKDEEKKMEKDKKEGFGGFKGYDGFGSGYWDDPKDKKKRKKKGDKNGDGDSDFNGEVSTFGIKKRRRMMIVDEEDVDVYDYDDMQNEKKCMVLSVGQKMHICVGYDYVEIKEFVKREAKKTKGGATFFTDDDFMQYVAYEHENYKAMMMNDNNQPQVAMLNDGKDLYTHYLSVYEFIYDVHNEYDEEQCFVYLEPFEICLTMRGDQQMIVSIENEENNSKFVFDFDEDNDWNEIDENMMDSMIISTEKCVRLFQLKMCVHSGQDYPFKVLLYKTT